MYIAAAGAKFGQRDKGFTVRSRGAGIAISASNVVSRAMTGVHVLSPGATISGNVLESNLPAIWVPGGVDTVIDGNHIVNSFFEGIKITSDSVTISHNVVAGNGGEGVAVGRCARDGCRLQQGPGADPADLACGNVDTVPFLTRAVVIPNLTGR